MSGTTIPPETLQRASEQSRLLAAKSFEDHIRADQSRRIAKTIRECSAKASAAAPDAPDTPALAAFAECLADVIDLGADTLEGR